MVRYPFSMYPNSWFQLAWSDEVAPGQHLKLQAFGRVLIVLRAQDGGLTVHEGSFPNRYAEWPVCEKNKMIFTYHHKDQKAPSFEVPELPEVTSTKWTDCGRIEWKIKTHVQELIENSVDLGHFRLLHGYAKHAKLVQFKTDTHTYASTVSTPKLVLGIPRPCELTIQYHGMGFGYGGIEKPVPLINLVTCLPLDEETLRIRFTIYARLPRIPVVTYLVGQFLRWHIYRDVNPEFVILNDKAYYQSPLLLPGDGPIFKIRRWSEQFY